MCMCIYIYTHMYICTQSRIHKHKYVYIYIYIYMCLVALGNYQRDPVPHDSPIAHLGVPKAARTRARSSTA